MDLNPYIKYVHYFGGDYTGKFAVPPERFISMIANEGMNLAYLEETFAQRRYRRPG